MPGKLASARWDHRGADLGWLPSAPNLCLAFDDFDDPLGSPGPALELAAPDPRPRVSNPPPRPVDAEARGRAIADLPDPPEGLLAAVGYAWKSARRLKELGQLYERAAATHELARKRARSLRTELGAALHRMGSPELGPLVAAVDGAATTAEEREAALAEMRAAAAEERARHAKALGELERELHPWQSREGRARAEVDVARRELEQAKSALRNVETEMQPLGGDPAALAPFKETYDARRHATTRRRMALEAHEATLAEARDRVAHLTARIDTVETEGRRVDRELRDAEGAAEAAASFAGANRGEALRTLAHAALERGLVPDDLTEGPVAARATGAEAEGALEVRIHRAALGAADDETRRRGAAVAVAGLAAVVALGFFALFVL